MLLSKALSLNTVNPTQITADFQESVGLSIEANRRIAWDFHAALNNRDIDKAMSMFADDASWIVMPGATMYNKQEIRKYLEKTMKNYPKFVVRDIHPPGCFRRHADPRVHSRGEIAGRPGGTDPSSRRDGTT